MLKTYSAFTNDALGTHDATGISELIKRGDISLDEALDAAISRARSSQSVLNAMVIDDFERVKIRAKEILGSGTRLRSEGRLIATAFL